MLSITAVIPDLSRFTRDVTDRVDAAVAETALAAANDVKASMLAEKSGALYRRGKVTHQASAPGEAPAVDTRQLVGSIVTERLAPMRHAVNANTEYAIHLEYGTRNMAPRPFMRPALERSRDLFVEKVSEALKR